MVYQLIYASIILLLILATVLRRRKGRGYDYILMITALITGFYITGLFNIQHWYYHLPMFGITVSLALLFLSLILILFGVPSRRMK
jgi:disulfide bond formation protein DsbB